MEPWRIRAQMNPCECGHMCGRFVMRCCECIEWDDRIPDRMCVVCQKRTEMLKQTEKERA